MKHILDVRWSHIQYYNFILQYLSISNVAVIRITIIAKASSRLNITFAREAKKDLFLNSTDNAHIIYTFTKICTI